MWRAIVIVGLAMGVTFVPVRQVAACDCAFRDLPDAIAEADVAIVGTLVGVGPSAGIGSGQGLGEPVDYTWAVERSRDPLDTNRLTIAAMPDDGANCGISFEGDDRWLVLAHLTEGRLETNGCLQNTRLTDAPPESLDVVDALVATPVDAGGSAENAAVGVPGPLLVGLGALALVAIVSLLAFRRAGPGDAG